MVNRKPWKVTMCSREASVEEALIEIYLNEIVPLAEKGLCASIFTQVSDVEDETNGLLTYDRKECKLQPEEMKGVMEALQRAVDMKV